MVSPLLKELCTIGNLLCCCVSRFYTQDEVLVFFFFFCLVFVVIYLFIFLLSFKYDVLVVFQWSLLFLFFFIFILFLFLIHKIEEYERYLFVCSSFVCNFEFTDSYLYTPFTDFKEAASIESRRQLVKWFFDLVYDVWRNVWRDVGVEVVLVDEKEEEYNEEDNWLYDVSLLLFFIALIVAICDEFGLVDYFLDQVEEGDVREIIEDERGFWVYDPETKRYERALYPLLYDPDIFWGAVMDPENTDVLVPEGGRECVGGVDGLD
jgi:Ca2+/Na+ antiporter